MLRRGQRWSARASPLTANPGAQKHFDRSLISSILLRETPKGRSLALVLYFLVEYSLCCVVFSLLLSHTHPPTRRGRSCPRAREMFYGLRRKKEQSLSARCTESTRCPVVSMLSVVARSLLPRSLFPPAPSSLLLVIAVCSESTRREDTWTGYETM